MNIPSTSGLIAAPFTPMNNRGDIRLDPISIYADFLIEKGVKGVFICGTTGEGLSLTMDEKKAVVDEWVRCSAGRLIVIVHAGGLCQPDCALLAQHAETSGADGIAAMAPFFFKPESATDLVRFFEPVASAAVNLPFYYYHIPSMTGIDVPAHLIFSEAADIIPNFSGIKYSHSDLMDLQLCMALSKGQYEIMYGSDETLISALSLGIKAAVGSTYNYMPTVYLNMINAFNNNQLEKSREFQLLSVRVVQVLQKHGGPVRAGKAVMEMIGVDCGPCRPPVSAITASEKASLKQDLSDIGFNKIIDMDV